MNDSVLAFQTQTEFEKTPSTTATVHYEANEEHCEMECDNDAAKPASSEYNTNYQINELEQQLLQAECLIEQKSFFGDLIEDLKMQDDRKLVDYFSQQNRDTIHLRAFNGHVALSLQLKNQEETEYSTISDMRLVFDFDRPMLKLWSDRFYLFYADRPEDRNFVEILKIILGKRFEDRKAGLLAKFTTTEFLANIETEVELMLNRVADFAKDIKITSLKFIRHKFLLKQDDTFE